MMAVAIMFRDFFLAQSFDQASPPATSNFANFLGDFKSQHLKFTTPANIAALCADTLIMGTGKKEASRKVRQGKVGDGMANVKVKGENFYRYVWIWMPFHLHFSNGMIVGFNII
jgi:nuclear GTP-binding protein